MSRTDLYHSWHHSSHSSLTWTDRFTVLKHLFNLSWHRFTPDIERMSRLCMYIVWVQESFSVIKYVRGYLLIMYYITMHYVHELIIKDYATWGLLVISWPWRLTWHGQSAFRALCLWCRTFQLLIPVRLLCNFLKEKLCIIFDQHAHTHIYIFSKH